MMKKNQKIILSLVTSILIMLAPLSSMTVSAAPASYIHVSSTPIYHSKEGCLKYVEEHGMESFCTKETLNLEQFLIDNPDLVTAQVTERDMVWDWIVNWDAVSPRKIHSTNEEEEYYCRARNLCIDLGVYGPTSKLSVKEKCLAIQQEVCKRCDYDFSYSRYSYKSIMDENTGVCNAFATYGMMMFTIAGIENGFVEGPNHIWNAVLAEDGNWYQIDLCWDACYGYSTEYFWMKDRCNVNARNMSITGNFMIPKAQDIYITADLK